MPRHLRRIEFEYSFFAPGPIDANGTVRDFPRTYFRLVNVAQIIKPGLEKSVTFFTTSGTAGISSELIDIHWACSRSVRVGIWRCACALQGFVMFFRVIAGASPTPCLHSRFWNKSIISKLLKINPLFNFVVKYQRSPEKAPLRKKNTVSLIFYYKKAHNFLRRNQKRSDYWNIFRKAITAWFDCCGPPFENFQ